MDVDRCRGTSHVLRSQALLCPVKVQTYFKGGLTLAFRHISSNSVAMIIIHLDCQCRWCCVLWLLNGIGVSVCSPSPNRVAGPIEESSTSNTRYE